MELIDTHCHLNAETFNDRWLSVLNAAQQMGVHRVIVVGWDQPSSLRAIELAHQDQRIKTVIGLHPVEVDAGSDVSWIVPLVQSTRSSILAIGEIGLDYYWKKESDDRRLQAERFIQQINLANQLQLPVVIHCRDAYQEVFTILQQHPVQRGGIMHCYAGPSSLVDAFIKLGFYLSFGGPITFKNAHEARESVRLTPLHRILIETDSPYLSPHPFRGKENTPERLPLVFETIAQIKQINPFNLEKQLFVNTLQVFHVKTL